MKRKEGYYNKGENPERDAVYEAIDRRQRQMKYIDKMRNLMPSGYLCSMHPVEREDFPDCDKWEVHTHGPNGVVIHPCDHLADVEKAYQSFLYEITPKAEHEALTATLMLPEDD